MPANSSRSTRPKRLRVEYTTKPVSGWGGLLPFVRFLDTLGVREVLAEALPDGRTSPNQTPVVHIVLALFATVLTGGRRFAHVERLRADDAVKAIFNMPKIPSGMTLTRYFGGFLRGQVERMVSVLWHFTLSRLECPKLGMVLDLDSTVMPRFGHQQGSRRGYNPTKKGRPSHHPLIAFLAEPKIVLNAWMRSGNTHTANGCVPFLQESLARLPQGFRLYAARADSGFCNNKFLSYLESSDIPYVVAVPLRKDVTSFIRRLSKWTRVDDEIDIADAELQAQGWEKPRRIIIVRELERERLANTGRKLVGVPGYTFRVFVSSMPHPADEVWRFYDARSNCENQIKELKDDFAASAFCLQTFDGTDAVFRLICFLYNETGAFKRQVLRDSTKRLNTIRWGLFVVGAILGSSAGKEVLRLGLRSPFRQRFEAILEQAEYCEPTVMQPRVVLQIRELMPPSRWSQRRVRHRKTGARGFPTTSGAVQGQLSFSG